MCPEIAETFISCVNLTIFLRILFCLITHVESYNFSTTLSEKRYSYYNIGVLMASRLDSPFDLERCGPAVDLALEEVNEKFLAQHGIRLRKVQAR